MLSERDGPNAAMFSPFPAQCKLGPFFALERECEIYKLGHPKNENLVFRLSAVPFPRNPHYIKSRLPFKMEYVQYVNH
jgi:hypothetical protein